MKAKIIKITKQPNPGAKQIVTVELTMPKILLAQLNTHRVLSKSSESSRAVSITSMIDKVKDTPIFWEAIPDTVGMYGNEKYTNIDKKAIMNKLNEIKTYLVNSSIELSEMGLHKEVVNRLLEPFALTKVLVTCTEVDNLFKLRVDKPGAQKQIKEVISEFKDQYVKAIDSVSYLSSNIHVPYVWEKGTYDKDKLVVTFTNSIDTFIEYIELICNKIYSNHKKENRNYIKNVCKEIAPIMRHYLFFIYNARKAARTSFGTTEFNESFLTTFHKVKMLKKEEHNSVFEHSAIDISLLMGCFFVEKALTHCLESFAKNQKNDKIADFNYKFSANHLIKLDNRMVEITDLFNNKVLNRDFSNRKQYSVFAKNGALTTYTANYNRWMPFRNFLEEFPVFNHFMMCFIEDCKNENIDINIDDYLKRFNNE